MVYRSNSSPSSLYDSYKNLTHTLNISSDKLEIAKTKVEIIKNKKDIMTVELKEVLPYYNPEYPSSVKNVILIISEILKNKEIYDEEFNHFVTQLQDNMCDDDVIFNHFLEMFDYIIDYYTFVCETISNTKNIQIACSMSEEAKKYFTDIIFKIEENISEYKNKKNQIVEKIKATKFDTNKIKHLKSLYSLLYKENNNNYLSDSACNYYACNSGFYNVNIIPCCNGDF